MGDKCIFCGKEIEKGQKTKEHVLPKWLIEMTGSPKRNADWGIDYNKIMHARSVDELKALKRRKYPFDDFVFPACKGCNEKYGNELEGKSNFCLMNLQTSQKAVRRVCSITIP